MGWAGWNPLRNEAFSAHRYTASVTWSDRSARRRNADFFVRVIIHVPNPFAAEHAFRELVRKPVTAPHAFYALDRAVLTKRGISLSDGGGEFERCAQVHVVVNS